MDGRAPGRRPRAARKRATGSGGPPGQAPKRRRKRPLAAPRRAAPRYLVHETDDDVLLLIPNVGAAPERPRQKVPGKRERTQKPVRKRPQQKRAGERGSGPEQGIEGGPVAGQQVPPGLPEGEGEALPPAAPSAAQGAWGKQLPVEILVQIFRLVVALEGSVPFLCRMARVCQLWYGAASSPALWKKVSVSHCWTTPSKKCPPALEKRVLGTVEWLAANRFSHLQDFALCHWKSHVAFVLKALGSSCPLLASLKLSYCGGVTTESLCALAGCCPQLNSLNLQNSQVDSSAVLRLLEAAGPRIRCLWLTYSSRMSAIMAVLSSGSCPELRLLDVNTEIEQSNQHFQLPVEQLQAACPQLQVLRLINIVSFPKPLPASAPSCPGFPLLEELCLATAYFSLVDDRMLQRLLRASSRLRVLDLRGCFRVTPRGLGLLPCPDVEQLYLGLYCSANHLRLPLEGSPLITGKWSHSLRELDLTGQCFSESDLEQAMAAFALEAGTRREPVLRSLNVAGTKVAVSTVSALIASCPALGYLNLSSCRHLPRGTKKAYRGRAEIHQCLQQLLSSSEEPARAEGPT
uniref:F-box and leucine rich repeat protein 6 n=2 Tax=Varanus komodoensis TaxID=61221 RepID=A0A8D2IZT5_VARKO